MTAWTLPPDGGGSTAVERAASTGAEFVHLDLGGGGRGPLLVVGPGTDRLLAASAETGCALSVLSVNVLNDVGITASRADEATCRVLVEHAVVVAESLRVPTVMVPSFRRSSMSTDADVLTTSRFLAHACRAAGELGITVATENVLPPSRLEILLDEVDSGELSVLIDPANLIGHSVDVLEYVLAVGDAIASDAHVKDTGAGRAGDCDLGTGGLDVLAFLDTLISRTPVTRFVVETDHRSSSQARIRADVEWLSRSLSLLRSPHHTTTKEMEEAP